MSADGSRRAPAFSGAVGTLPMSGEPDAAALIEARLVQAACDKEIAEQTEARVKEMKAAVDASIKQWRDAQPECWEMAREEYQWRHEYEMQNRGRVAAGGG